VPAAGGLGTSTTGGTGDLRRSLALMQAFPLLRLDHVDRRFEPVAMMGHGFGVGDILLAQAGLQRLACGLIDLRSDFSAITLTFS
jgi:hypothetical protein